MPLLSLYLSGGLRISSDTCHISVMDYPTDSAENLERAFLYPVSPDFYGLPYAVIRPARAKVGQRLPLYRLMAKFWSAPLEAHSGQASEFDASFLTIIW